MRSQSNQKSLQPAQTHNNTINHSQNASHHAPINHSSTGHHNVHNTHHNSHHHHQKERMKTMVETQMIDKLRSIIHDQEIELNKKLELSHIKEDPDYNYFKQKLYDAAQNNTFKHFSNDVSTLSSIDTIAKNEMVRDLDKLQIVIIDINSGKRNVKIKVNKYIILVLKQLFLVFDDLKIIFSELKHAGMCGVGQAKRKFLEKYAEFKFPMNLITVLPEFESANEKFVPVKHELDLEHLRMFIGQLITNFYPEEMMSVINDDKQIVEREVVKYIEVPKIQIVEKETIKEVPVIVEKEKIVYINTPQQAPTVHHQEVIREIPDRVREAHEYLIGLGRPQNIQRALDIYYEEAEVGHNPFAMNALGQIFLEGKIVNKDLNKAIKYYTESAQMQDSEGLYRYAKMILDQHIKSHESFPRKMEDAIAYLQQAAELGHLEALCELGDIFQSGIKGAIEPNLEMAEQYLIPPKKERYPKALYLLGTLYKNHPEFRVNEKVVGDNERKALKYFEMAAELGHVPSYFQLGNCYEHGLGSANINIEKAKHYYKMGVSKGDRQCKSYYQFFVMQDASNSGKYEDYQHAAQYFRKVLDEDPQNEAACYYLGHLYENGYGVNRDPKTALHYYTKGHQLNHPPSTTKIGDFFKDGTHGEANIHHALKYYQVAAKQNDPQANFNLGLIHLHGYEGQRPNLNEALRYLKTSADQNHAAANHKLGEIYDQGLHVQPDSQKAIDFYKKAANLGHIEAHSSLMSKGVPYGDEETTGPHNVSLDFDDSRIQHQSFNKHISLKEETPIISSHLVTHMPKKTNPVILNSKFERREL